MKHLCMILVLGLGGSLAGASLEEAGVESYHGLYMRAAGGGQWYPNYNSTVSNRFSPGSNGQSGLGEFALGLQGKGHLGLELGLANTTAVSDVFIGPTLRLPVLMGSDRPFIHGFGLRGDILTAGSGPGSAAGPVLFGRRSNVGASAIYSVEKMLGRRFSLGLQAGYQWAQVDAEYSVATYTGSYVSYQQFTERHDISGPRLAATLAFWPKLPYHNSKDLQAIARKKALRQQRLAARRNAYYQQPDPWDSAFSTAGTALSFGQEQLQKRRYDLAAIAFAAATRKEPGNAQAWRLLGRTRFLQGDSAAAVTAYEQASSLEPEDEALKAFIADLHQKLTAQE